MTGAQQYHEYLSKQATFSGYRHRLRAAIVWPMFTGVFRDRSHFRAGPARTPQQILKRLLHGKSVQPHRFLRRASIGPFVVDYVCPEKALVIEVMQEHRAFLSQDAVERAQLLERFGYRVLRFWSKEIVDSPDLVLRQIVQALS